MHLDDLFVKGKLQQQTSDNDERSESHVVFPIATAHTNLGHELLNRWRGFIVARIYNVGVASEFIKSARVCKTELWSANTCATA